MFGLPWFKKSEEVEEVEEVDTTGFTHSYDVPVYERQADGTLIMWGIAEVYVQNEEADSTQPWANHAGKIGGTNK